MTNQVENFIEQYEQELIIQETNANKRILNGFVWFLAAVALLWLCTMTGILDIDKGMVTISFLLSFVLYLPTFYLIHRGKVSQGWIKYFLLSVLCVVSAILMSVLSYHAALLHVFPLLYSIQYREKKIIWVTYFVNLATMTISAIIGFYFGICDLNLFLHGHHTRSWYLNAVTDNVLSVSINEAPLFSILVLMVLPRALMLLLLSIMLQYTVISNTRDALRIAQLTYHKDTDTYTKVFNKNKYEEMITKYYPGVDRLAIIFFDLNNLKKVNDELGHAMGDYIIETLASVIRSQSNDSRRVYRIGGDEFVMILESPAQGDAELVIAAVREQLSLHNETGPVAVSTAAGFAYGKGMNILEVVKEADEKMYENKLFIKNL